MSEKPSPAAHQLPFGDGDQWAVWRTMVVRGAGFPAALIRDLASSECAAVADRVLDAEEVLGRAAHKAQSQQERIRSRLARRSPVAPEVARAAAEAIERFNEAQQLTAAARAEWVARYRAEELRAADALRAIAAAPRLREALLLQNRAGSEVILRGVGAPGQPVANQRARRSLLKLASYLQRYCLKNDNISFFGPVGWASYDPSMRGVSLRAGRPFVEQRTIYLEHWAVDALASAIAAGDGIRPWLAPRRSPLVWLADGKLHSAGAAPSEISRAEAWLFERCDGDRSARAIARAAATEPELGFADEQAVCRHLEEFVARGWATWTLDAPTFDAFPERAVRSTLERIGDPELRARALAPLDELEAARAEVAGAAGDPDALVGAIDRLTAVFERRTGTSSTRKHGETYAGRTLFYEDCRRNLELRIGGDVMARLAPPLELLLESCRWFTHTLVERFRAHFRDAFLELRGERGQTTVDLLSFHERVQPLFGGRSTQEKDRLLSPVVTEVREVLQEKWALMLGIAPDARECRISSAAIRDRVAASFAAPHPGVPLYRFCSPDLLIAADGTEAIDRGDYRFVIGEIHVGLNTITMPATANQHPDPASLYRAREIDLPEVNVLHALPKESTNNSSYFTFSRHDLVMESEPTTRTCRPRSEVLYAGDLVLEERDGELVVRTRRGDRCFEVGEFFAFPILAQFVDQFEPVPLGKHTPRVILDDLVISRERWSFVREELPIAEAEAGSDRVVKVRRWARRLGLPRYLFVKIPEEKKPFALDLDSPLLCHLFTTLIRNTTRMTLSEMLPRPDQLWMTDADCARYTCELRLVLVDRARPPA